MRAHGGVRLALHSQTWRAMASAHVACMRGCEGTRYELLGRLSHVHSALELRASHSEMDPSASALFIAAQLSEASTFNAVLASQAQQTGAQHAPRITQASLGWRPSGYDVQLGGWHAVGSHGVLASAQAGLPLLGWALSVDAAWDLFDGRLCVWSGLSLSL
jgi:hypothetical protein